MSERGAVPKVAEIAADCAPTDHALVIDEIRGAMSRCEAAGVDKAVVNAVLLGELLPRLVQAYGIPAVAGVFTQLADYVVRFPPDTPRTRQ